jgi:hypothetical protein
VAGETENFFQNSKKKLETEEEGEVDKRSKGLHKKRVICWG